jgi:hypothetical protein
MSKGVRTKACSYTVRADSEYQVKWFYLNMVKRKWMYILHVAVAIAFHILRFWMEGCCEYIK